MVPSTLDIEPSTLNPRQKDRLREEKSRKTSGTRVLITSSEKKLNIYQKRDLILKHTS